ncbi:MAG: M20/M25/M40 family metallo-hydrolase [Planctomycetota bacterium]
MARKNILHLLLIVGFSWALWGADSSEDVQERLRVDVEFLASDALEGRDTGTKGNEAAALFIKSRLTQLGYKSLPGAQSMLLPFGGGANPSANVAAWLPGLSDEVVILGAHFDHIGHGGDAAISTNEQDDLYNGANDNASGVAGILEVARALKDEKGHVRGLVIVAFNAEEKGLLGSIDFLKKMRDLLEGRKVVAMINLDMIGQLPENNIPVMGSDSSQELTKILSQCAERQSVTWFNNGYIPLSDHHHFYKSNIPVLFFFSGLDMNYHGPNDESNTLNYKSMTKFVLLLKEIIRCTLITDKKFDFQEIDQKIIDKSIKNIKISMSMVKFGVNCNDNFEVVLIYDDGYLIDFNLKLGDKLLSINDIVFSIENLKTIKSLKRDQIDKITVLSESKRIRVLTKN